MGFVGAVADRMRLNKTTDRELFDKLYIFPLAGFWEWL